MPISTAIHVFVADDHALFRKGVKETLTQYANTVLYIAGEAADGSEAIEAVTSAPPHVVLMDVHMPGMDGIEATTILKKRFPRMSVIGLSYSDESENVLAMVDAGCDGYLLKDTDVEELILAVKTVSEGRSYFTPRISQCLAARIKQPVEHPLTIHEKQILQLVCDGSSSKEIASALHVSKRTVDTNRERIMRKLGVTNVIGLLRYAMKRKLLKH